MQKLRFVYNNFCKKTSHEIIPIWATQNIFVKLYADTGRQCSAPYFSVPLIWRYLWMQITLVNAKKLKIINCKTFSIRKSQEKFPAVWVKVDFSTYIMICRLNDHNWPEDTYKPTNLLEHKYFKYLDSFEYYTETPCAYVNVHMQEEIAVLSLGCILQWQPWEKR